MAKKQKTRRKRNGAKFLFALLAMILFPVGFNLYGLTLPKRYTAEMRLLVDQTTTSPIAGTGPFHDLDAIQLYSRPRTAQTQLDTLTGSDVLESAYEMASDRIPDKLAKVENKSAVYDDLVRRLGVDNEPMSDVLSVRVTEDDPEVAAELANDIGFAYIKNAQRLDRQSAEMMTQQLKEQTDPLVSKLKSIDAQISDLKHRTGIYDIAQYEANLGSTKEAADRSVAMSLSTYAGTKAQLAVAEAQLKEIPQYINSGSVNQINPVLISIQTSLASETVALAQLRAQYDENFPLVREEKQKIADLKQQLQSVKQTVPSQDSRSLNPVYQSQQSSVIQLRALIQSSAGQLAAAQQEQLRTEEAVAKIPAAEQQLQSLLRDRSTYEQTYEQLAQRETMAINSIKEQRPAGEIVSPALPPISPSFPDKKLLTLTGIALGIFFAVLILMPRPEVVTEVAEQEEPVQKAPEPLKEEPLRPLAEEPAPVLAHHVPERELTPMPVQDVRTQDPPKGWEDSETSEPLNGNGDTNGTLGNGRKKSGPAALAQALKKAKTKSSVAGQAGESSELTETGAPS